MTFQQTIAVAGLLVSMLTPLTLLVLGNRLNRRLREHERAAERDRKISETRFEIYKDIGFKLNDIYCYFLHLGAWQDLTADEVLHRKRNLDRHFYTYRPLFSEPLFQRYSVFMCSGFETFGPMGTAARLRTSVDYRRERNEPAQHARFTGEDNREEIKTAYFAFMDALAVELGVRSDAPRGEARTDRD
jgi:hypothetical protein